MDSLPDIYFDGANIVMNGMAISIALSLSNPKPQFSQQPPQDVAVIRTNLGEAKLIAMLLKRLLKQYEGQVGAIPIPQPQLQALELSVEEDWA